MQQLTNKKFSFKNSKNIKREVRRLIAYYTEEQLLLRLTNNSNICENYIDYKMLTNHY